MGHCQILTNREKNRHELELFEEETERSHGGRGRDDGDANVVKIDELIDNVVELCYSSFFASSVSSIKLLCMIL
jgi:hypothetical protein